jgi:hypothetical protein
MNTKTKVPVLQLSFNLGLNSRVPTYRETAKSLAPVIAFPLKAVQSFSPNHFFASKWVDECDTFDLRIFLQYNRR